MPEQSTPDSISKQGELTEGSTNTDRDASLASQQPTNDPAESVFSEAGTIENESTARSKSPGPSAKTHKPSTQADSAEAAGAQSSQAGPSQGALLLGKMGKNSFDIYQDASKLPDQGPASPSKRGRRKSILNRLLHLGRGESEK